MRRGLLLCLSLSLYFALAGGTARAFDAYLWLDEIKGESVDYGYRDWIEVVSYAHRIGAAPASETVPGAFGYLVITKYVDRASPRLSFLCAEGRPVSEGRLDCVTRAPDAVRFYRIDLRGILVCSVCDGGAAAAPVPRPIETVRLAFDRIEWSYTEVKPTGDIGGRYSAWWSLLADTGGHSEEEPTDADGDGISDASDPDDDNDGMSDAYELACGLDPFVPDGDLDPDHDGLTNHQESVAGTAANDPDSVLRVSSLRRAAAPGSAELTWTSVPGKQYDIEFAVQLEGPYAPFTTAVGVPAATTTTLVLELPPGMPGLLFFRVGARP